MEEPYETKTKSGKIEERILKDKGKFVRYTYIDKATGKATKDKLILIGKDQKAYFMIPTGERELAIRNSSIGDFETPWNHLFACQSV